MLFFLGTQILGFYRNDTVLVDIESNFDLWNTTRCRRNVCQLEATKRLVVRCHWTLTLKHVDVNSWLVVRRS